MSFYRVVSIVTILASALSSAADINPRRAVSHCPTLLKSLQDKLHTLSFDKIEQPRSAQLDTKSLYHEAKQIPARAQSSKDPIARIVNYITLKFREGPIGIMEGSLFRGFASRDYTEKDLIRYFKGDRGHEVQSWDYSQLYRQHISNGLSAAKASELADMQIARNIRDELNEIYKNLPYKHATVREYYYRQVSGTNRAKVAEQKRGTAIPFSRINNGGGYPVGYLMRDLNLLIKEPDALSQKPVGILLKVKERQPRGIGWPMSDEYYILSHVPVADVEGAYVAFPKESAYHSTKDHSPQDQWLNWYYVSIMERNDDGSAKAIAVSAAKIPEGSFTPTISHEIFHWSKEKSPKATEKILLHLQHYPDLIKLIGELLK